jgi:hypothetical protein
MYIRGDALKLVTDEPLSQVVNKPAFLTIIYGLVCREKLYPFEKEGKLFHIYPELTVVHDTDGTVTIGNVVYQQGDIPSFSEYMLVYIVYTPDDGIYYKQLKAIQLVSVIMPPGELRARLEEEIERKYRPAIEREQEERFQALTMLQETMNMNSFQLANLLLQCAMTW